MHGDWEMVLPLVLRVNSVDPLKYVGKAGKGGQGGIGQATTDLEEAKSTEIAPDGPPGDCLRHHCRKPAKDVFREWEWGVGKLAAEFGVLAPT